MFCDPYNIYTDICVVSFSSQAYIAQLYILIDVYGIVCWTEVEIRG